MDHALRILHDLVTTPKGEVAFFYDAYHVRTGMGWTLAKQRPVDHAKLHGAAGTWKANGTLVLAYRDGDRIRRKSFAHATRMQGVPTLTRIEGHP
jgi:hypothetical protein